MLFLSIGLWVVVVVSARIAIFGNPLYLYVCRADPGVLARLDAAVLAGGQPEDADAAALLKRFGIRVWLELVVFLLETGLLVFLFWRGGALELFSFALLFKNMLMVGICAAVAKTQPRELLFTGLRELPTWLVRLDRISSAVSAGGCLVLFLHVNEIV